MDFFYLQRLGISGAGRDRVEKKRMLEDSGPEPIVVQLSSRDLPGVFSERLF